MIKACAYVRLAGSEGIFCHVEITFPGAGTDSITDQALRAFHYQGYEIDHLTYVRKINAQEPPENPQEKTSVEGEEHSQSCEVGSQTSDAKLHGLSNRQRARLGRRSKVHEPALAPDQPDDRRLHQTVGRVETIIDAISRMSEVDSERGHTGTGAIALEDARELIAEIDRLRRLT